MQPLPQRQHSLTPYGHSSESDSHSWSQEYLHAAFARAQYKAANVTTEAPVGPDSIYLVYAIANLTLGVLWLFAMVAISRETNGSPNIPILPLLMIGASFFWFQWHKRSRPTQSMNAVYAWVSAVMRKKWERVDRLRVSGDRDNFPRRMPVGDGPSEMPMSSVGDVERYWREVRRRMGIQGRWRLRKPVVRPLNQQMALVEMELLAARLPQWTALIGVGVMLALVVGMFVLLFETKNKVPDWIGVFPLLLVIVLIFLLVVVGWTRKHHIRKVVIYTGNEWRVFSGEWQGPEDRDLRWLQAAPPAYQAYTAPAYPQPGHSALPTSQPPQGYSAPVPPPEPPAPPPPPREVASWDKPKGDGPTRSVEKTPWE